MESRVYPDPEGLFQVEVPNTWLADTSGQGGLRVAFLSPEEEADFRPSVNVVTQHVPPLTIEEYVQLARLQLKQLSQSESLLRDNLADSGAQVFDWINHQAPMPLWVRQQLYFGGNKAFVLSATCLQGQRDDVIATFESILASFKVIDKNG